MNRLRKPSPLSFPAICIQTCVLNNLFETNKPFAKTTPFPTQPHTQWATTVRNTEAFTVSLTGNFSKCTVHKIIRKKWADEFFPHVWTQQVSLWFADGGNLFLTLPTHKLSVQAKKHTFLPDNSCRGVVPPCLTQKHLDTSGSPRMRACGSAMLFTVRAPRVNILGCFTILPIGAWNRVTGLLEKQSKKADLDDRWNCCSPSYRPTNS